MKRTLADRDSRRDLELRLALLQPSAPALWGKMNAGQMVCHLIDAYHCATGDRTASDASGVLQRSLIKWVALRVPLPWPKGLPTRPEFDQLVSGTPPAEFEADRRKLVEVIGRFCATPRDFAFHPHPIFGQLSELDWMRWGWLHADHHLRQFGV